MSEPQSTGSFPPPPPPYMPAPAGVFGTKIPSAVAFAVGVLLFVLPFAELKCNPPKEKEGGLFDVGKINVSFSNTGLGLALGSDWKLNMPSIGGLFNNQKEGDWKKDIKPQEPNVYAIIALVLAVLGLGLSFTNAKAGATVNIVTGALSAAALIGLMIDLKKKSGDIISGMQKTGNSMDVGEYTKLSLNFTPWFYVAVIALLVAAFFSFKRMQSIK